MTNARRRYTCQFLILNILFTLLVMQYICQGWGQQPPANVSYQAESVWIRLMHEWTFAYKDSVACGGALIVVVLFCFLWQFPHAQHVWTPFRKHLLLLINRPMWSNRTFATIPQSTVNTLCEGVTLTEYVNSLTCHILNHNVWYITVFPRQQPSPRPSQHFATCHIFPLPRIKNRC